MADKNRAINRVFTKGVISDLLEKGHNDVFDFVVRKYVDEPQGLTHGELISEIYAYLKREQRNEYYYQNTLLKKLLDGVHSVNTTTALSQVRIGRSVADLVMINGDGIVYEIKSELDNFDRLEYQLHDYYQAFSKTVVVVPISSFDRVNAVLNGFKGIKGFAGVYAITEQNTLSNRYRIEPKQNNACLSHTAVFKLLRKREYETVLLKYFGNLPKCDQVFHFRVCQKCFESIPMETAQKLAYAELRKRNSITKDCFTSINTELKSVVYFSNLSSKMPALEKLLETQYGR